MARSQVTSVRYETGVLRQWLRRRRDKGIEPNADQIWFQINACWPGLTDDEKERVFQNLEQRK